MPGEENVLRVSARRFVSRHPLFAVAIVAALSVLLVDGSMLLGLAFGLGLSLIGWTVSGWKTGLAWLVCVVMAVGVFTWRNVSQLTDERILLGVAGGEIEGRMLEDASGNDRFWSATAVLINGPRPGARVWWEGRGELPVAGSWVKSRGNFIRLPEPRNPGDFDKADWLRNQGVSVTCKASWMEGRVWTGKWAALGARVRLGFRTAVTDGLPEASQAAMVIRAVVIGEKPPDADELIGAFRNSGTLHAFSVSGLHVSMVGTICWLLLRLIGLPRRRAVLLLLVLIFGYSWLTGNSPPATRSAWMAAVFLMAFVFRRKPDLLNALGAVLLAALLWDGRLLFLPGVQLSYGVVAAIALGMKMASRAFAWIARPELYLPMARMNGWQKFSLAMRQQLASLLGVSLAAGVGSAPLTIFHFGLFTPVSILAGVIIVPTVGFLLGLALFSVMLYPVAPSFSRFLNRGNGYVANFCAWSAEGFASLPGGHFQVRRDHQPYLLVYDLEHGDGAACLVGGSGEASLLDCGGARSFKWSVQPSLCRLGVIPDSVVISHPDGGHLGGGQVVWNAFPVRQVLLPVKKSLSPAFRAWANSGLRVHFPTDVKSLPMPDGATLEILNVPDPMAQSTTADERVMISRLHWHGWKLLFTSDAGVKVEEQLLESGLDLSADVIISGHNTGDDSLSDAFLTKVRPQVIVASHSDFPPVEQLDSKKVNYWRKVGIHVFNQGESGGVTIRVDEVGHLRLEGFVNHSVITLKPR